jgi:hypothetical protein
MNRVTNFFRLIGFAAIFGLSNAAYAECSFEPGNDDSPDGVSDLSGQGNFTCADFNMDPVEVTIESNGDWAMLDGVDDNRIYNLDGLVTNTPDQIVLFRKGQGTRCSFSYFRNNSEFGTELDIGGNVETTKGNSFACTDGLVNNDSQEVDLGEPDIVLTGDICVVTLEEGTGANDITNQFDVFTASNLDGTKQAICSADPDVKQNECVQGCPKFIDIDAIQKEGIACKSDSGGRIPLFDTLAVTVDNPLGRCTPCLTAAQARIDPDFLGFDTGKDENGKDMKLCWEYNNGVDTVAEDYKPHKQVRAQTTHSVFFNECIETTTTFVFFGRERTKTVTTCTPDEDE